MHMIYAMWFSSAETSRICGGRNLYRVPLSLRGSAPPDESPLHSPALFYSPTQATEAEHRAFKYNGAAAALELKICETWPSQFPRTRGGGVLTDRFCLLPYETERQQSFTPKKLKQATFLHVCSKNCPTAYLARCIFG